MCLNNSNEDDPQGRRPLMEEDVKILKIEYLNNHRSDLPQILKLSLGDQTKMENTSNEDDLLWKTTFYRRRPSMEDNLL